VNLKIPSLPTAFPDWFPFPLATSSPGNEFPLQVPPECVKEEIPKPDSDAKMEIEEETRSNETELEKDTDQVVERKGVLMPPDFPRIIFDPAEKLGTMKILELLKFAMLEALPAEGFVIENFPLDLGDVVNFERTFYPATLGIYFTETFFRNRDSGRALGPLRKNVSFPCHHQRIKGFSYEKGEQVVQQHGEKVICIVNAESVTNNTLKMLENLLDTFLTQRSTTACSLQIGLDQLISQDVLSSADEFGSRFDESISIGRGKKLRDNVTSKELASMIMSAGSGSASVGGICSSAFEEHSSTRTPPLTEPSLAISEPSTAISSWFYTPDEKGEWPTILEDDEELSQIGISEIEPPEMDNQDSESSEPQRRIKKRRGRKFTEGSSLAYNVAVESFYHEIT